jgi:hypothetical protein
VSCRNSNRIFRDHEPDALSCISPLGRRGTGYLCPKSWSAFLCRLLHPCLATAHFVSRKCVTKHCSQFVEWQSHISCLFHAPSLSVSNLFLSRYKFSCQNLMPYFRSFCPWNQLNTRPISLYSTETFLIPCHIPILPDHNSRKYFHILNKHKVSSQCGLFKYDSCLLTQGNT